MKLKYQYEISKYRKQLNITFVITFEINEYFRTIFYHFLKLEIKIINKLLDTLNNKIDTIGWLIWIVSDDGRKFRMSNVSVDDQQDKIQNSSTNNQQSMNLI